MIDFLKMYIKELQQEINGYSDLINKYNYLCQQYEKLKKNPLSTEAISFDLDENLIDEKIQKENLRNIQQICNSAEIRNLYLKKEETLKKFFNTIDSFLEYLNKKIISYNEIINKINDGNKLIDLLSNTNLKDRQEVHTYLMNILPNFDIETQKNIYDYYIDYLNKLYDMSNTYNVEKINDIIDEDEIVKETNITFEELKNILNEYKYDINEIKGNLGKYGINCLEYILKYGNLKNIKEVLETLKNKYRFNLPNESLRFAQFIVLAKKENIDVIYQYLDKKLNEADRILLFNALMKRPSDFINTNKIHKQLIAKEKNNSDDKESEDNCFYVLGNFNNVTNIFSFFENNDMDVALLEKCPSILDHNVEVLKRNFYILKNVYEVPDEKIKTTLSSLIVPIENIDRYIEMNNYNYIKEYPSTLIANQQIFQIYNLANTNPNNPERFSYYFHNNDYHLPNSRKKTLIQSDIKTLFDKIKTNNPESTLNIGDLGTGLYDENGIPIMWNSPLEKKLDTIIGNTGEFSYKDLTYDNNIINLFDTLFKKDEFIYNFNELYISRHKFIRILGKLAHNKIDIDNIDVIMYALTYKSIISTNQVEKIYNMVKNTLESNKEENR